MAVAPPLFADRLSPASRQKLFSGKILMRTVIPTFLAASIFLSGCTVKNSSIGRLSPAAFSASNTGVVVFSVGAPRRCLHAIGLEVHNLANRRRVPRIGMWVNIWGDQSDFPEYHVKVNALELPPGSYYLYPFMLSATSRTTPTVVFDVRAGETTYAGELLLARACALDTYFVVRNQYERDIGFARKMNPAIEGRSVVTRLLRAGPTEKN
jgi:hypothetical protein